MMRWLGRLLGFLSVAVLAFAVWMGYFAYAPVNLNASPLDFTVKAGSGLRVATRQMVEVGIDMPAWQFTLLARALGKAASIKAGSYEIEQGITPWRLLEKLTRGDVTQAEIVFPEGWTFRQMRAALDAHPDISHDSAGLSERQILERLDIAEPSAEGLFFPDTYLFSKTSSDIAILKRSSLLMKRILEAGWNTRAADLPYASPYQALIMASIIEKETGQAQDRPLVASVFVNRLKAGMLLQTDPTIVYGLGEKFDGILHKRDLTTDGPYNTYTRSGLPPTPIAMPGQASIDAALHAPTGNLYYFVARGDGTSQFSRTLEEHNRAVMKYQKRKGN